MDLLSDFGYQGSTRTRLLELDVYKRQTGSRSTRQVLPRGDSDQGGKRYLPRDVRRQIRGGNLRPALLPEEDSGDPQAGQGYCRGALSRSSQREEGKEMKIDTEIRHVTKPGANLFLELGFAPDEAKRLQACLLYTSRCV